MIDWAPLRSALARCRQSKTPLPVWWRDDDAIAPTPQLDQLHTLSVRLDVPVHLAVIPAHVKDTLAEYMVSRPNLRPMVHGWAHQNHAEAGMKKSEFPHNDAACQSRASEGFKTLTNVFGSDLLPVFVPPWNRMDTGLSQHLKAAGYHAVSAFGPRKPQSGILHINTHIDPIFWRGTRGLVPPEQLIAQTVERIETRRNGTEDAAEPLGYLTHHLVHDPDIWAFSYAFLSELLDGGATPAHLGKDLA
ncbi:polysaccharide deacetylase family protein [Ascidiaceihabitans sp.]|uniref:polysaccharide deacetylase family protein n=1 Tax=Ascidiaceihabitans sp. TaxID=1872644 RepID=UPI0032974412